MPTPIEPPARTSFSVQDEQQCYHRLDVLVIGLSQFAGTHGAWAEFILSLLRDIANERELVDRVLVGDKEGLEFFRQHCTDLAKGITDALRTVDDTFYALATEEQLTPYLEPGCRSSPISYVMKPRGEIDIQPNRDVLLMLSDGDAVGQLIDRHIAAQLKLLRLIWNVPLKPAYLLERLEDFSVELTKYRDQLGTYRVWQSEVFSTGKRFTSLESEKDEMHRKGLWGSIRSARLFPADMIQLGIRLASMQQQILDVQAVILTNSSWVVRAAIGHFAEQARRKALLHEDLVAEGMSHLAKMMRSFDWRRGARFSTYAMRDVKSFIRDLVAADGGAFRVPSMASRHLERVRAVQRRLTSETGWEPTVTEVAAQVGITVDMCRDLMLVAGRQQSLQSPAFAGGNSDEDHMSDVIADEKTPSQRAEIEHGDEIALLHAVLRRLPAEQRNLLGWLFGLEGKPKLTVPLIAQKLRRPVSQISLLTKDALRQVRAAMESSAPASAVELMEGFFTLSDDAGEKRGRGDAASEDDGE